MTTRIPFDQHGACQVALICLQGQQKRVYHYSKTIGQEDSWALRDYATEQILRSADSELTASELETMVTNAADAAYRAVGQITKWKKDCKAASDRLLGAANVDTSTANDSSLGTWRRMNGRGA